MDKPLSLDLNQVAHELKLPPASVAKTVALLDEGNTVPFITRFRRELSGGLDEEQIRAIQKTVASRRMLVERKSKVLKSIEIQGKLTPELKRQIEDAPNLKRLGDLYLPYKPKKQSLATQARAQGLEPLALEILHGDPPGVTLEERAAAFVSPDRGLPDTDSVLAGVKALIADIIADRADVRGKLRKIFYTTGTLVCSKLEPVASMEVVTAAAPAPVSPDAAAPSAVLHDTVQPDTASPAAVAAEGMQPDPAEAEEGSIAPTELTPPREGSENYAEKPVIEEAVSAESAEAIDPTVAAIDAELESDFAPAAEAHPTEPGVSTEHAEPEESHEEAEHEEVEHETEHEDEEDDEETLAEGEPSEGEGHAEQSSEGEAVASSQTESVAAEATVVDVPAASLASAAAVPGAVVVPAVQQKKKKKKKKKKVADTAFKDYYKFREAVQRLPPHRILAINRGERANILKVKIEADYNALGYAAEEIVAPSRHPHAEFLRGCLREALHRSLVPSLEREERREMSERAEQHAVDVFVRNLRKLLLQPPVHNRRVLAVDPGYKTGCKLAALDEFGNVLGHGLIFIVGKDNRRARALARIAEMVREHNVSVIAIGNGTGSRETELLVAEVLAEELKEADVAYVTVNEAGASVYSTSPLGREELPTYDPILRSAISIGRRLLDPLSELVKINPANIGVGLYQHDMSAKHLRDSLDAVVESCVNYVGVDVNTASPALLRYVSGLNALTARRIYEHRRAHGPFRTREDLKKVPGVGAATFVQAAGFLKVIGGDNPLDATWVHPESYDVAIKVLDGLGSSVEELAQSIPAAPLPIIVPASQRFQGLETLPAPEGETPPPVAEAASEAPVPSESPTSEPVSTEGAAVETAPAEPVSAVTDAPSADTPPGEAAPAEEAEPAKPAARPNPVADKANAADLEQLAKSVSLSPSFVDEMLMTLARPLRDPRDDFPAPLFRKGVMKLDDLSPGMELSGTVLNVVDFGAFVDLGLTESGLVHISRLADRYVRDPHEVVSVGDVLKVWVVDIDKGRRRVSLTAIQPGSERPPQGRGPRGDQAHGEHGDQRGGEQRGRRDRRPQRGGQGQGGPPQGQQRGSQAPPRQGGQGAGGQAPPRSGQPGGDHSHGDRPRGGGGRGGRGGGRGGQQPRTPRVIEVAPTKPKVVKPITKAQQDGKEPMRSFADLMQFFDKDKKKGDDQTPPPSPPESNDGGHKTSGGE
jgi:uncharacterized protein